MISEEVIKPMLRSLVGFKAHLQDRKGRTFEDRTAEKDWRGNSSSIWSLCFSDSHSSKELILLLVQAEFGTGRG